MTEGVTTAKTITTDGPAVMRNPATASWWLCLVREPLVHFLILGGLLFGLDAFFQDDAAPSEQRIVVSAGKIEHLSAIFAKTWQRPPTHQELQGLIDDYIQEEVAYREGKEIGLDQDDTIIRRRIRQKLDFFADDMASQTEPTEAQLAAFFDERREAYATDAKMSFRQVFFDPERHDAGLEREIKTIIRTLSVDPSKATPDMGDRSLLEQQYSNVSEREVSSIFGDEFASEVARLPLYRWQGPVRSAYGLHAVIIDERESGRLAPFDEVREAVRRDWEHQQRKEMAESFYQRLREKYQVTIEWPDPVSRGE